MITQIDCEKLIVAYCLQGAAATRLVYDTFAVDESDMSNDDLRIIYGCCVSLVSQNREVNALEMQNFINGKVHDIHFLGKERNKQERIDQLNRTSQEIAKDFNTLKKLTDLPTACKSVIHERKRNTVLQSIHLFHDLALKTDNIEEELQKHVGELLTLQSKSNKDNGYSRLSQSINQTIEQVDLELSGKIVRISSGFENIDRLIKGFEKGALYVVAAEEKVGKSILTGHIALNMASKDVPVGIISMEMQKTELIRRFSGATKWASLQEQKKALIQFQNKCQRFPLYIKSGSGNTQNIIFTIRNMVSTKHVACVIVDYLQLVDVKTRHNDIRVNEVNTFVASLKSLAQDLAIPIILISAVNNKQVANKSEKRPSPSDLRDSGRIANDCDVLMFLWKPYELNPNYLELYVSRGRNGEHGECSFNLNTNTLRLEEVELNKERMSSPNISKKTSDIWSGFGK